MNFSDEEEDEAENGGGDGNKSDEDNEEKVRNLKVAGGVGMRVRGLLENTITIDSGFLVVLYNQSPLYKFCSPSRLSVYSVSVPSVTVHQKQSQPVPISNQPQGQQMHPQPQDYYGKLFGNANGMPAVMPSASPLMMARTTFDSKLCI